MGKPVIERADELPLVIYWLLQMRVDKIIDAILLHPHPNRQGLRACFESYVKHLHK